MKRNFVFVLALIAGLSAGCGSKDSGTVNFREINLSFDVENSKIKCSDVFSSFQLVRLQSDTSCLLDEIEKIKAFHDTLFISDRISIKLFSAKNGSFIRSINRKGRSPEEYQYLVDFDIDTINRQLLLLDRMAQAVKYYSFSGEYIKQIKLGYWSMNIKVSGNDFILYNANSICDVMGSRVTTYSMGKLVEKFLPVVEIKGKYLNVLSNTIFSKYRENVILMEPFNDTVYQVTTSSLEPRYVFNPGKNKIPEEFFQKEYYDIAEFFTTLKKTIYANGVYNFIETDSTIFLNYWKQGEATYFKIEKGNFEVTPFTTLLEDFNLNGVEIDLKGVDFHSIGGGVAVCSIPAFKFIEYIEKSGKMTSAPKLSPGVQAIANSIKANDNPIVCIVKVK